MGRQALEPAQIADELDLGLDAMVFLGNDGAECELCAMAAGRADAAGGPDPPQPVLIERRADRRRSTPSPPRGRRSRLARQTDRCSIRRSRRPASATITRRSVRLPRVCDLILKTNQFNLTTRRYSPFELKAAIADSRAGVFSLRLTDRFGDNGIVGTAIVRLEPDARCEVEALLLISRVIGRTAETALLAFLVSWARQRGALTIEGEFIPTARNGPAADFYARHGFARIDDNGGRTRWRLRTEDIPFTWPCHIRIAGLPGVLKETARS